MSAEGIVQLIFIAFVGSGLSTLLWRRFSQLEAKIDQTEAKIEILRKEVHEESRAFRTEFTDELRGLRTEFTDELRGLRTEFTDELRGLRTEFSDEFRGLRADLTQIALAVGAQRPQASQG